MLCAIVNVHEWVYVVISDCSTLPPLRCSDIAATIPIMSTPSVSRQCKSNMRVYCVAYLIHKLQTKYKTQTSLHIYTYINISAIRSIQRQILQYNFT